MGETSRKIEAVIEADARRRGRVRRVRLIVLGTAVAVAVGFLAYWQINAPSCDGDVLHRAARVCFPNPGDWPEQRDNGRASIGTGAGEPIDGSTEYVMSGGPFRLDGGDLAAIATDRSACRGPATVKPVGGHSAATVVCDGSDYSRLTVIDVGRGEYSVVEAHTGPGRDHAAVDAVIDGLDVLS